MSYGKYRASDGTTYNHVCDHCAKNFRTCCPEKETLAITKCDEYVKKH